MPRHFVVALAAAALFFSASPFAITAAAQDTPQSPAASAQSRPRRPMPKPTNLQVLPKDIAVPDLLALMRSYTGALGVECEFCHSSDPQTHRPDYASDANPDKAVARTMMTMTNEINAKYLSQIKDPDATPADKTVTCGTCHRGNSMPASFASGAAPGTHHDHMPESKSEEKAQ